MPETQSSIHALAERLGSCAVPSRVDVRFGDCRIGIASNMPEIIEGLRSYFRSFIGSTGRSDLLVTVIESDTPEVDLEFREWEREPGKTRLKEIYADVEGGRLIRKVRTGMQFLIGSGVRLAIGPALANMNQVVNFVITQYINCLLHRGGLLCHAAAVVDHGRGLGIAAVSGGGKSTLALHLLSKGLSFTSNDRLLIERHDQAVSMSGVPKLPRINPGTALHNENLRSILSEERVEALLGFEEDDLWDLEEKYDVHIEEVFDGVGLELQAPLAAFLLLNWERPRPEPPAVRTVRLETRPELVSLLTKSPGPFFETADGLIPSKPVKPDPESYVRALETVPVFEVTGGIDFDWAVGACLDILRQKGKIQQ